MTNSKDTDLDVTKLISNMGKSIGESEINSLSLDAQKSTIELQEQINSASESLLNVKKPVLAKQDSPEENAEPEIKHKTLEEAMSDLNELTGMKEVKKQINELTQLIKINKLRKEQGIDGSDMSHHLLFLGNPGTGKSTVSRIVADIYWNLGVVEKGQLIETERAKIVKGYVGQTGANMLKICESAVGGILVIDEMYSLAGKGENDFGTEALETLLKFMEDNRDKIVVIGCGYTKEMQNLIDTNSGLRSRFSNFIDFENYTPEQCLQILDKMISKYNIKISDDKQRKVLLDFFGTADNDSNFANARAVRNLQEYIIAIQSTRLGAKLDSNSDNESEEKSDSSSKSVTKKELTTINLSDINEAIERYFSINHKISNGEING